VSDLFLIGLSCSDLSRQGHRQCWKKAFPVVTGNTALHDILWSSTHVCSSDLPFFLQSFFCAVMLQKLLQKTLQLHCWLYEHYHLQLMMVLACRFHEIQPQTGLKMLPPGASSRKIVSAIPKSVPYPVLQENTLVLSNYLVVGKRNGKLSLMFR